MSQPKIKTQQQYVGNPPQSTDWCAYDENTYDGSRAEDAGAQLVGWGRTEAEAVADFLEQWEAA